MLKAIVIAAALAIASSSVAFAQSGEQLRVGMSGGYSQEGWMITLSPQHHLPK